MSRKGDYMKKNRVSALFLLMVVGIIPMRSYAFQTNYTSIRPGTVWLANDSVHIDCHGGNIIYSADKKKYYWYGEHYASPAGVACYSSTDLYNWVKEGIVLQKGVIQVCERPKVIYSPTIKKYVMWFHYDNSSYTLAHLAVATADSATGQFTMLNHFLPNGHQSRDIGMFTDTTGKTYIVYAADQTNVTIRMVELTADYTNVTTADVDLKAHCEGPGMLKYKGNYYMITSPCLGWAPGQATWYMSPAVTGTYVNKGDPCIGDNSRNTFNSQSCFVFKIPGYENAYMYMGDRWNGSGNKNSQYVFLPIAFSATGALQLNFSASWNLGVFTPTNTDNSNLKKTPVSARMSNGDASCRVYDLRGRRIDVRSVNARSSAGTMRQGGLGVFVAERKAGTTAQVFLTIGKD
jgi:beta-galactosidase